MQGKLSSRSNSIWSINKSNRIVQELQPSGHLNLMIRHPAEYQWARSMLGQLDQSTEQTICNIHTNIITRQTNPLCTEAFNENSNSKKPRNYVARATINLTRIHFYPRPVLKNNKGDQNMTRAYQQHRNIPPNCSVGRSIQTRIRRSPPGTQTKDTVDFWIRHPRWSAKKSTICFKDLKNTLTSYYPSAFVHKSYSDNVC